MNFRMICVLHQSFARLNFSIKFNSRFWILAATLRREMYECGRKAKHSRRQCRSAFGEQGRTSYAEPAHCVHSAITAQNNIEVRCFHSFI